MTAGDIRIDGQAFALRQLWAFDTAELIELERVARRFGELTTRDFESLSDDEAAELDTLLARLVRFAIDAPPDVLARLYTGARLEIARVFVATRLPHGFIVAPLRAEVQ